MGLIGLIGALSVVAVATMIFWLKAATIGLTTDRDDVMNALLQNGMTVFRTVIVAILVVELWPGLARWATDAYAVLVTLL